MKTINSKDIYQRLSVVETQVKDIGSDVKDIMNNHIPHLNDKIDRFQWWLVLLLGGLVVNIALMLMR